MGKNKSPHIAIVGAGAIGSLLGGMLVRDGQNVTLIGNSGHVKAINQHGLKIEGVAGEFVVVTKAAEELDFTPDMVFVSVKTQDVETTCKNIKPYIGDIPIIMMQNGVASAEIAGSYFGKEKIISCMLLLNARFQEAGVVTYVKENPIVVGEAFTNNDEDQIKEIQALLNTLAKTEISKNILGAQWSKLFINSMSNALDGMTGLPMGEYIQYQALRRIGILILKEALQLVDKADIQLESLPGFPLPLFKLMTSLPIPISTRLLKFMVSLRGSDEIITSTLQSLKRGRKTEIDYLNGEFVNLGKQIGSPAPYNAKVVELIHEIERSGSFYTPEKLTKIFANLNSAA